MSTAARVHALFVEQPWRTRPIPLPHRLAGMLGDTEEQMFYFLAKEYFTGRGAIVDAGSYLGRSAYAFAQGLRANPSYRPERDRVQCFDMFVVLNDLMAQGARDEHGKGPGIGESMRPVFERQVAPVRDLLEVHEGDFTTVQWPARPVEILMVDIAKTAALGQRVVDLFFPGLVPGVSIVVHQDYHHPWLPHIHVVMEHLSDCFELVASRVDASAAFLLTKAIPPAALARARVYDFSPREQIELMDRAIRRLAPGERAWVELARVLLLSDCGVDLSEVRRELAELTGRRDGLTDDWRCEAERVAEAVVARCEGLCRLSLLLVTEFMRRGQFADAERQIVASLLARVAGEEGPDAFLSLLGTIWLLQPDAARAVAVMTTLCRELPDVPEIHVLDAKVWLHLGDRAAAAESLRRARANGLPADRAARLARDLQLPELG